jgi:hypothetical protein
MANKGSKNKAVSPAEPTNPVEKYLAFGFLLSIAISAAAVFVILLAPFVNNTWVPTGWGMIPILVMPFGFLCLIALLVVNGRNRNKANRSN